MPVQQHLEIFVQDLRYAARGFLRTPGFTLAAIFAIALGTGASTAVFSVVDRILFRDLPYPQSDRLVSLGIVAPIVPQEFLLGYDYIEWRESQTPFTSIGSWMGAGDCDLTDRNPARLKCASVDYSLLPTLGVQPIVGRNFTHQEDRPNAPKVALISYGLWRRRFAGDPNVMGKALPLDGKTVTVLGVLPPQFELPTLESADVFVPQALDVPEQLTRKTATVLWTVARLKPGVTVAQAAAALQPQFERALQSVDLEFRKEIKLRVRPLRDRQIQDSRLASWILLGAVLAVLLIACANVANLLLARAATRQREMAVRAAIGAGRGRLIRQALTESTLLALAGGIGGCGLAFLLLRVFVAIAPEGIPRLSQAGVDMRVLLFALALSLASGILFGLAPAFERPHAGTLGGWRTVGGRHHLFRYSLVSAQISISLILLTGASLLLRSLWNLQNQPLGMRTESVLTAAVTLGAKSYAEPSRRLAFFEELESRLRRVPGVNEVALSDSVPPTANPMGSEMYGGIWVRGRPRSSDQTGGRVGSRSVTPGYFSALDIPVLRGRGFQESDRDPHRNVAILSDALARRMFPGEDPLGQYIRPGREWLAVVGVVGNVRNNGLIEGDDPEFYEVRRHSPEDGTRSAIAILRTGMNPPAMAGRVRAEIAALDPTLPVDIETMRQRVSGLAARPRFNAVLLGVFAGMGLLLAAIGLYGVVSFLVVQRTQEIGVRMALGADPGAIVRLVLGRAARWTAAGAVAGVIGSLFAVRLLGALLFRVSEKDPWIMAVALALLVGIAMLASWIPARRAARVDPMLTLRQ